MEKNRLKELHEKLTKLNLEYHGSVAIGNPDKELLKRINEVRKEIYDEKSRIALEWWKEINISFSDNPGDIPEIPGNLTKEDWDVIRPALIRCGAIPKEKLEVGEKYLGHCRNASEARWDGTEFNYVRHKFKITYPDSVPHFDDAWMTDEDVFIPVKKI